MQNTQNVPIIATTAQDIAQGLNSDQVQETANFWLLEYQRAAQLEREATSQKDTARHNQHAGEALAIGRELQTIAAERREEEAQTATPQPLQWTEATTPNGTPILTAGKWTIYHEDGPVDVWDIPAAAEGEPRATFEWADFNGTTTKAQAIQAAKDFCQAEESRTVSRLEWKVINDGGEDLASAQRMHRTEEWFIFENVNTGECEVYGPNDDNARATLPKLAEAKSYVDQQRELDKPFIVSRDGKEIARFWTLPQVMSYLHRAHPYSIHHACKYEGYSVEGPEGEIQW